MPRSSSPAPHSLTPNPMTRDFLITGREVDDLTPLEEQIRDVCRGIYDPEIPIPIWDMGLIYGWTITDGEDGVRVDVTIVAPTSVEALSPLGSRA